MGRLVLRSSNAQVVLPDRTAANAIVHVEYRGEALVGAVIVGSARLQMLADPGASLFGISMRLRRLGLQRMSMTGTTPDIALPGFHVLSAVLLADLIPGDIIECILGQEPIPNCVLVPNGFQVVIL